MNLNGKVTNPGELNKQVTLLSRAVAKDAGGFQTSTRTVLGQVWAKWVNVHGSEVWAAEAANAKEPATITIRYLAGVDETIGVYKGWVAAGAVVEAEVYEVVSMDNIGERNEYIELKIQRTGGG